MVVFHCHVSLPEGTSWVDVGDGWRWFIHPLLQGKWLKVTKKSRKGHLENGFPRLEGGKTTWRTCGCSFFFLGGGGVVFFVEWPSFKKTVSSLHRLARFEKASLLRLTKMASFVMISAQHDGFNRRWMEEGKPPEKHFENYLFSYFTRNCRALEKNLTIPNCREIQM